MIAFEHPPLRAALIRRRPPLVLPEAGEQQRGSATSDLRFFAGAYLGALAFFLVWLA